MKKILSIDIGITNLAIGLIQCKMESPYRDWSQVHIEKLELVNIITEIHQGKKVRLNTKEKNAKTENIHLIRRGLLKILNDRIDWIKNITDIRVEQQPLQQGNFNKTGKANFGSSRMKILEHCVLSFFESYYLLHPDIPKPTIESSSPANKLKCIIDVVNYGKPPMNQSEFKTVYKQRKEKSKEGLGEILHLCQVDDDIKSLYYDKNKKDDMADCVLQAIYEIQVSAVQNIKTEQKALDKLIKEGDKINNRLETIQEKKIIKRKNKEVQEKSTSISDTKRIKCV
jgi:hypothetical protein